MLESRTLRRRHDVPRRSVTVPSHGFRSLKPGTLRSIIRQTGLTVGEFRSLLQPLESLRIRFYRGNLSNATLYCSTSNVFDFFGRRIA